MLSIWPFPQTIVSSIFGDPAIRIDAVPKETFASPLFGNVVEMDRFIVSYKDPFIGFYAAQLYDFNFLPSGPLIPIPSATFDGSDVAATLDLGASGSGVVACVTGVDGNQLQTYEIDVLTGTVNNLYVLDTGLFFRYPRIEAFGIADPAGGSAKWTVASSQSNLQIRLFTDFNNFSTGGVGILANSTLTGTHEFPSVAAGIGMVPGIAPNNIGNEQYGFAWGHTSAQDYYAMSLDQFGSLMNPSNCSIVNTSASVLTSDPSDGISMSNSCNSGYGTIIAWNRGDRIMYKILDNTYAFRPGRDEIKTIPKLSLSPNPANNSISIQNPSTIEQISISNALGQEVLVNRPNTTQAQIDISKLPSGNYFVTIKDNTGNLKPQKLVVAH